MARPKVVIPPQPDETVSFELHALDGNAWRMERVFLTAEGAKAEAEAMLRATRVYKTTRSLIFAQPPMPLSG